MADAVAIIVHMATESGYTDAGALRRVVHRPSLPHIQQPSAAPHADYLTYCKTVAQEAHNIFDAAHF